MSALTKPHYTPEEYLAVDRQAEYKSEYRDGEIFAMSGASRRHNLIVTNLIREISLQLKGRPCEVYSGDMRVWIGRLKRYFYPDVVALCGEPRFEDVNNDTLLNPALIIEVLSKSTEAYDRGDKFADYRIVESITEYVMISQDKVQIDRYVRQPDNTWVLSATSDPQGTIHLSSINCNVSLAEIYDKVDFAEQQEG